MESLPIVISRLDQEVLKEHDIVQDPTPDLEDIELPSNVSDLFQSGHHIATLLNIIFVKYQINKKIDKNEIWISALDAIKEEDALKSITIEFEEFVDGNQQVLVKIISFLCKTINQFSNQKIQKNQDQDYHSQQSEEFNKIEEQDIEDQPIETGVQGKSKQNISLKHDRPQIKLDLNDLEPSKNPSESKSILEFAVLIISQKLNRTLQDAKGIVDNSFMNKIIIDGLNNDFFPILEWQSQFLVQQEQVVQLTIQDTESFQFTLKLLRAGFFSESADVVRVTCQVFKSLLGSLSQAGLDEYIWNQLEMSEGGIGAIVHCYLSNPSATPELVGVIQEFGKSNLHQLFLVYLKQSFDSTQQYFQFLSDILESMLTQYQVAQELIEKGVLSAWLNEALAECESTNNLINRSSSIQLLMTLWGLFQEGKGFDNTANQILATVQRATRTRNKVVNVQTVNLMFFLLEKFILINNEKNVDKIYKSITFSLIENFDDFFMREVISSNLRSTILKMGLNVNIRLKVNILIEPLLIHQKGLKLESFSFSCVDFQLLEQLMLTLEQDAERFGHFLDVVANLLNSTSLFSNNLVILVGILLATHGTQPTILVHMSRLLKNMIKDMLEFERSIKSNPIRKGVGKSDRAIVKIKRTILLNMAGKVVDIANEKFTKTLVEMIIKQNNHYKQENDAHHPTLKTLLRMLGASTSLPRQEVTPQDKIQNLLKSPIGQEVVEQMEDAKPKTNPMKKNKEDLQKARDLQLKEQELERVKQIQQVNNEAKIRDKNRNFWANKQKLKEEMLLKPLDVGNTRHEVQNPQRELQSDLIVVLLSELPEEERVQLKAFLHKFEIPLMHTLKKQTKIGSAKDFEQAKEKSEVISMTNLHRFCSEMQIQPLFLKKEELDVCILKYIEKKHKAMTGTPGYTDLHLSKAFNFQMFEELVVIIAVNMFRKPPIDLSNQNSFVSLFQLMKHLSDLERHKQGNWVIWDTPMYSGLSLNLDQVQEYNRRLALQEVTLAPTPLDPSDPNQDPKEQNQELAEDKDLVKSQDLPTSILEVLGESQAVVLTLVDQMLQTSIQAHFLEHMQVIADVKKLKPIPKKKEWNLKLDTIAKNTSILRRMQIVNQPILQSSMSRIPEQNKKVASIIKIQIEELYFAMDNDMPDVPNTSNIRMEKKEEMIAGEVKRKRYEDKAFKERQKELKLKADEFKAKKQQEQEAKDEAQKQKEQEDAQKRKEEYKKFKEETTMRKESAKKWREDQESKRMQQEEEDQKLLKEREAKNKEKQKKELEQNKKRAEEVANQNEHQKTQLEKRTRERSQQKEKIEKKKAELRSHQEDEEPQTPKINDKKFEEQLKSTKEADEALRTRIEGLKAETADTIKAQEKALNRAFKHQLGIRRDKSLKDVTVSDLMEQKGFSVFLTDFKLLPHLLEAQDSLRIFNFINNGYDIDSEMFKNIAIQIAAFQPERVIAFKEMQEAHEEQRPTIEKQRVDAKDLQGKDVKRKMTKIEVNSKGEGASAELVQCLLAHFNLPEDPSNLKWYIANITSYYKEGVKVKMDKHMEDALKNRKNPNSKLEQKVDHACLVKIIEESKNSIDGSERINDNSKNKDDFHSEINNINAKSTKDDINNNIDDNNNKINGNETENQDTIKETSENNNNKINGNETENQETIKETSENNNNKINGNETEKFEIINDNQQ